MRSLIDMDTIQIEITNSCINQCANCTRFVGHIKPFFMSFEQFKKAIDSMIGYPKMVGIMGGEPLLHSDFEKFCEYALSKIPREQLGLWTCLPSGYEHYREVICSTFGNIFINDHSRNNIMHHPFLVAIKDVVKDKKVMLQKINNCWAQLSWSASINSHGAFFCEIAASFSMLFGNENDGWKVEPGWWWRMPWDFKEQIEKYCPNCGGAANLKRRVSIDKADDISVSNYDKLKNSSKKIKAGRHIFKDFEEINPSEMEVMQSYKDKPYRSIISSRYGIFLTLNCNRFDEPHLSSKYREQELGDSIMENLYHRYRD